MAAPTYYPEWALLTQNLPATGQTNKVRPKESLRNIGFDLGQLPTCEEYNFLMNNTYLWIKYFNEEIVENLDSTYLPRTGTKITLTGNTTGSATFNDSNEVSIATETTIPSSAITDATSNMVVNTVVKRDGAGGITAGDIAAAATTITDQATFYLNDFGGNHRGQVNWNNNTDILTIDKLTGSTVTATIALSSSGATLPNPISSSAQGGAINALTRKDYVDNEIVNLNNNLVSFIQGRSSAALSTNGWHKDVNTGVIIQWGTVSVSDGGLINFPTAFPSACVSVQITQLASNSALDLDVGVFSVTSTGFNVAKRTNNTYGLLFFAVGF